MVLYFITGNKNKFEEAKHALPEIQLEQTDLDLDEVQSLSPKEVIGHKLDEAKKVQQGEFIVEDVSFSLDALNGLPGPLIKWFLKSIGCQGLFGICDSFGSFGAEAKATIGYTDGKENFFFEGSVKGRVVAPETKSEFGWDPVFRPEGHASTFAEMEKEEKNKISHRGKAIKKFSEWYSARQTYYFSVRQ